MELVLLLINEWALQFSSYYEINTWWCTKSHLVKIQVTMYFSSKCEPICQPNILFHSLQVQPINVKNGTFSYAYDCTGFFNIPILMGLITTGVLLIILFIAVLVMFSLTTMDRFDDPKGPTIHVATG